MRKSSIQKGSSLAIAAVFIACIVLLIAGGVLLKLFLVLRASGFDGVHQYIVEIDESKTRGEILAFSPSTQSINVLRVKGKVDTTFGAYLKVPVDALVVMPLVKSPLQVIGNMLWHAKDEKGITFIDKIRLFLFANSLKPTDFHETSIKLPIDPVAADTVLPSLFLDNVLYADNETITVVNATGQPGIAADAAKMLTTIGMDVVSITTADATQHTTTIVANTLGSYTVNRLGRIFRVTPIKGHGSVVSDITLTIGKDSLSQLQ